MGRIEGLEASGEAPVVKLYRGSLPRIDVPIWLFPSEGWVRDHVDRWVLLDGRRGGARAVLGPQELIRHAVDPETGEFVIFCRLCEAELGRLSADARGLSHRALVGKIRKLLEEHLEPVHPEIFGFDSL